MEINVIGCGKMGEVYVRNLVERLALNPQKVVVYDVQKEKALGLAEKYNVRVADSIDALEMGPTIVATNTPSHIKIIGQLLDKGISNIFCEKPLCLMRSDADDISEAKANIYVAFLMRFSKAVNFIADLMVDERLHLTEATTQWGLNFYHNPRPLIGTLIDESVHGIDIINMLVGINQSIEKIRVSAMLTHPDYADPVVQKNAQTIDPSVPNNPDASVFANIKFETSNGLIPASVWSSYIIVQQTRRVCGVLSDADNHLAYAFEINFDIENKTKDHIVITKYKNAEVITKIFPCDEKIADETQAFLDVASGKEADRRLIDMRQSLRSVSFTEAILESHEKANTWVEVRT